MNKVFGVLLIVIWGGDAIALMLGHQPTFTQILASFCTGVLCGIRMLRD